MNRKIHLILLGAPGAGKGTQAEVISSRYGIPAVSTGAIIRQAIADGTALGLEAKEYIEKGNLVPDSVVIDIIKERLSCEDCANGFILDGFPRTVPQAEALEEMGVEITDVISIEVPDETIMTRMSGRRVCESCGATFHTVYKPSKNGVLCDVCGGKLNVRKDDRPEVVHDRLEVYHRQTEPLKAFYEDKNILKIVVGQEKVEDTTALTLEALEG